MWNHTMHCYWPCLEAQLCFWVWHLRGLFPVPPLPFLSWLGDLPFSTLRRKLTPPATFRDSVLDPWILVWLPWWEVGKARGKESLLLGQGMFPGSVTLGQEIPSKVAIGREREPLPLSGPCLLSLVSKESRGVRWSLPLGAWTGRRWGEALGDAAGLSWGFGALSDVT